MRIDQLEIRNFKKFSDYTLNLHPQFTLLVGDAEVDYRQAAAAFSANPGLTALLKLEAMAKAREKTE